MESIPVRVGDLSLVLTRLRNLDPGMAPSRAKAYIMREFEVIENVLGINKGMFKRKGLSYPQKNMAPITITYDSAV